MVDFMQAVKWMREGKKVREEWWKKGIYVYPLTIDINSVIMRHLDDKQEDERMQINLTCLEATDWQIYEMDSVKEIINKRGGDLK